MNLTQLGTLVRSFDVKRFHTVPTLREQTVGDHTAKVIALIFYLQESCSSDLLLAALEHDGLESLTGDVPATTKWENNFGEVVHELEEQYNKSVGFTAHNNLTEEEKLILKIADMAELCCRASAEILMGNKFMEVVFRNGALYLESLKSKMPAGVWDKLIELLGHSVAKAAHTAAPTPNVQVVPTHPDHLL